MTRREEDVLLARARRNELRSAFIHAQTKRGRLEHRMVRSSRELSDECAAVHRLYATLDAANPSATPLWLKLWRNAYIKLPSKGKRILNALAQDWRTASAAKKAGVSRNAVDRWKTFFKVHFVQSWRAYKRDFRF